VVLLPLPNALASIRDHNLENGPSGEQSSSTMSRPWHRDSQAATTVQRIPKNKITTQRAMRRGLIVGPVLNAQLGGKEELCYDHQHQQSGKAQRIPFAK